MPFDKLVLILNSYWKQVEYTMSEDSDMNTQLSNGCNNSKQTKIDSCFERRVLLFDW